jgi:hypothetical protein
MKREGEGRTRKLAGQTMLVVGIDPIPPCARDWVVKRNEMSCSSYRTCRLFRHRVLSHGLGRYSPSWGALLFDSVRSGYLRRILDIPYASFQMASWTCLCSGSRDTVLQPARRACLTTTSHKNHRRPVPEPTDLAPPQPTARVLRATPRKDICILCHLSSM